MRKEKTRKWISDGAKIVHRDPISCPCFSVCLFFQSSSPYLKTKEKRTNAKVGVVENQTIIKL